MPEFVRRIKSLLRAMILRGSFLKWWSGRKLVRVETSCIGNMVDVSSRALPETRQPGPIPRTVLKKLLFIADVMWEDNELVPELAKICEVRSLDLRPALRNQSYENPAAAPQAVLRSVEGFLADPRSSNADAVLFYARGALLSCEVFDLLRKACSGPIIGMNLDDKANFWPCNAYSDGGDHYRRWVNSFDLNLTNSRIASTWYREAGATCRYSPPAMRRHPQLTMPTNADFKYPLSFVGSVKLEREIIVAKLRDANIPVALFGNGWPDSKWEPDTTAIYRSSQINLGLGLATPNLATMKNRDFECPGVGACYLTTFNWELAEWWEIGKEILCYRNIEELVEIFCWYRNRPQDCLAIAQAAWKRADREHTWEVRFRDIFKDLGFDRKILCGNHGLQVP